VKTYQASVDQAHESFMALKTISITISREEQEKTGEATPLNQLLNNGDMPTMEQKPDRDGNAAWYCNIKNVTYHMPNKKWRVTLRGQVSSYKGFPANPEILHEVADAFKEAVLYRMGVETPSRVGRGEKKTPTLYEDGRFKAKCSQVNCKKLKTLLHFVPEHTVGLAEAFKHEIIHYDKCYDPNFPEFTTEWPFVMTKEQFHRDRTAECKHCRDKSRAYQANKRQRNQ
jgi:hypothetical protein